MEKIKTKFINFCARHGWSIDDGTRNECCDQSGLMPMLSIDQLDMLNEQGHLQFRQDSQKLVTFLESGAVPPEEAKEWIESVVKPVLAQEEQPEKQQDDPGPDDEDPAEFYFRAGFERGFTLGYDKGYDMATRILTAAKK